MKIFIDPGHNGRGVDPGAVGLSGLLECDVALAVARLVNKKLQYNGIETKMYRDGDVPYYGGSSNSDLKRRCILANNWGADYFISIHCNSASPAAHGTETYCYKFGGNGEKLARIIQDKLIHTTGLTNRGVKEGNFAVIRDTNMPAVLTELAFISNLLEEKILASPQWHDIMATAIASGICEFVGIQYKKEVINLKDYENHWAKNDIEYCMNEGIFAQSDTFRPDEQLTRAEAAVIMARLLKKVKGA